MGPYGQPDDLIGTLIWLFSDASSFMTGVVVPVDGGFSSYSIQAIDRKGPARGKILKTEKRS